MHTTRLRLLVLSLLCILCSGVVFAQGERAWTSDGNGYWVSNEKGVERVTLPGNTSETVIPANQFIPAGKTAPLSFRSFAWSANQRSLLIFTNTKRVWRTNSRGDYWVYDTETKQLRQAGKGLPASSLMFAKFSPDGKKLAYVSGCNLYVEDVASGAITPLTKDGHRRYIYGTFDWVYEEEFGCRDGFRWSPDGKSIAFWQVDARNIRDFLMINNTDSIYAFTIPVEYPKAGESPSAVRTGVIDVNTGKTTWLQVPGNNSQHYIPRMEWIPGSNTLMLQQLNRKQNKSILFRANAQTGACTGIYTETDSAWIDTKQVWSNSTAGWDWLNQGKAFVWVSEKDGWRHAYRVDENGRNEILLTKGNYDLDKIVRVDETNNLLYFTASPENATQRYLYSCPLNKQGEAKRISPAALPGTHQYDISPNGLFAYHQFSSHRGGIAPQWIHLPSHKTLSGINQEEAFAEARKNNRRNIRFFQVTTIDGVTMDGWMQLPTNFDSTKKYPVLFTVYGEPAGLTVTDAAGTGGNRLYQNIANDGYIYMSLENRGTPAPKGRAWRKSVYRKVGIVNARDQAMGAKEIMKWSFVDSTRIAVWGWSGGGSMTLNLLFQYPDIYQTGISVAAVTSQYTYNNIYQERYMGLPQENAEDFVAGSPITYARNLKGKLLYIHGTGDDNVHYQNAELLINELVKHKKQFQVMAYPNRSHGIGEGEGTNEHLRTLFTNFLNQHTPAGPR